MLNEEKLDYALELSEFLFEEVHGGWIEVVEDGEKASGEKD